MKTNNIVKELVLGSIFLLVIITSSTAFVYSQQLTPSELEYTIQENRYISDIEETDNVWFKHISYNSETIYKHRLLLSYNPDFSNIVYTEWQNYTIESPYHKDVEFNIPSTVIPPNSQIYYKVQVLDKNNKPVIESKVYTSNNTVSPDSQIFTELSLSGTERGYDYPWNWCHEILWDPYTEQFWALTSGEKEFLKKAWTSKTPYDWEYQGVISDDFPEGWVSHKGVSGFVLNENEYIASINIQDETGTGAVVYTGDSFVNMSLQGMLFKYGENENCTINCRLNDFWYNHTDNTWYGFVSGSSILKGTRTHVYLLQSSDLNFTGDFDDHPLYYCEQWDNASWTNSGIYPPNMVWMNGTGFAGVKGYKNHYKPYDFDADLIFASSPRDVSKDSFVTDLYAEDAYFNVNYGLNDTQRSVPVIQDGVIWMMVRNGVSYDAVGYVFTMTGYWQDETVRISPGCNPLYHYTSLPSMDEFNNMLNITVYVWSHEANVTIRHVDLAAPEYARLEIEGVAGDGVIVHIGGAPVDTVFVHVSLVDGVNVLTLTADPADSIASIEPTGDTILFEYTLR